MSPPTVPPPDLCRHRLQGLRRWRSRRNFRDAKQWSCKIRTGGRAPSGGGFFFAGGRQELGVKVAHQLVEALQHLAQGLLLLRRQRPVDAQDAVDVEAGSVVAARLLRAFQPLAAVDLPGALGGAGPAAYRLGPLVDDLQRVVEIVEIALEGAEDLLQGVERRFLLARLIGRQHGLGDACRVGHLVLPLRLPLAEPAEGPAEALKDGHARNVSLRNARGKRKLMCFNDLRGSLSSYDRAIYCLTPRHFTLYSVADDNLFSEYGSIRLSDIHPRRRDPSCRGDAPEVKRCPTPRIIIPMPICWSASCGGSSSSPRGGRWCATCSPAAPAARR